MISSKLKLHHIRPDYQCRLHQKYLSKTKKKRRKKKTVDLQTKCASLKKKKLYSVFLEITRCTNEFSISMCLEALTKQDKKNQRHNSSKGPSFLAYSLC